jgi:hypothetical protein
MSKKDPANIVTIPEPTGDEFFFGFMDGMMEGYRETMVFLKSVELRLFDHTKAPADAARISKELGIDAVMTECLCESIVSIGLLRKEDKKFVNTPMADHFLTTASPISQFNNVSMAADNLKRWSTLDDVIRDGPAVLSRDAMFNEKWITAIGEGAVGGGIGSIIKYMGTKVPLEKISSFIDVGGGHGLYAIGLSYLYPDLKGTIFDKPHIIEVAKDNILDYGIPIETISGDYYTDEIPGEYGLVFASFNQACSDPRLAEKISSLIAEGGYLFLRRHRKEVTENAIKNLEWNLAIWEGMPKGEKRHGGAFTESAETYIERLRENRVMLISREIFDDTSEVLVFKKERF